MESTPELLLVPFQDEHLEAFIALNKEWIQHFFKIEEGDVKQLHSAKEVILESGGKIFVVTRQEKVVGVCAMIPHGDRDFELAKMAVSSSSRGQGVGDFLMRNVIQWARQQNLNKITLLSNTILEPAIGLYKKHGFQTVRLGSHPDYERANITMELDLTSEPPV